MDDVAVRPCAWCAADISHRSARSLYCDKKCKKDAEVSRRDRDAILAKAKAQRAATRAALPPRTCRWCGAPINERWPNAVYCDDQCSKRAECDRDREIRRQRARDYAAAHPETVKAWRVANPDKLRATNRRSYAKHRERRREDNRRWFRNNPGASVVRNQKRRAWKLDNPGSVGVSLRDWRAMVARFNGACAYCGDAGEVIHMDHVVPLSKGGAHSIGNVLPACAPCNLSKSDKLLSVWRYRERGGQNRRKRPCAEGHEYATAA